MSDAGRLPGAEDHGKDRSVFRAKYRVTQVSPRYPARIMCKRK
jgi:hypothetical protein